MPRQLARAVTEALLDLGDAASDSVVTIAHRTAILAQPRLAADEWRDCLSEKAAAAWDGAVDWASAWQRLAAEAAFAPFTPVSAARHAVALARVAAGPAQARVRANAVRFGRG